MQNVQAQMMRPLRRHQVKGEQEMHQCSLLKQETSLLHATHLQNFSQVECEIFSQKKHTKQTNKRIQAS
jgi:hypothetical protein